MEGRHRDRADVLRQGVEDYARLAHRRNPMLLTLLARALVDVGDDAGAQAAASEARDLDGDYLHVAVRLLPVEAVLSARNGDDEQAVLIADRALALAETTEFYRDVADTLMAVGEVHKLAGRRKDAERAFQGALERYEHKQALPLAERARALLRSVGS